MTLEYLSDPIAALRTRLLMDDSMVRTRGNCETVAGSLLTSNAQALKQRIDPTIVLRSAGIGSGAGHAAQARYESTRIDCLAYAMTDFLAWRLSQLATIDIMNSRNKVVPPRPTREPLPMDERPRMPVEPRVYDGIEYRTRFITIVQSGGPNMFRDEHTDWPVVMTTWNIEVNSAKLTPAGA